MGKKQVADRSEHYNTIYIQFLNMQKEYYIVYGYVQTILFWVTHICSKRLKICIGMKKTKFNIVTASGARTEERRVPRGFSLSVTLYFTQ